MQERQTHVLALPARAEGRDRETEGILEKKKGATRGSRQKSTVFPEIPGGSKQSLVTQIHARRARCTQGGKGNVALVFSLSLMALVSLPHLSSLPLLVACSTSSTAAPSLSLFCLPLCPCSSVVTLFHEGKGVVRPGLYFSSFQNSPLLK